MLYVQYHLLTHREKTITDATDLEKVQYAIQFPNLKFDADTVTSSSSVVICSLPKWFSRCFLIVRT